MGARHSCIEKEDDLAEWRAASAAARKDTPAAKGWAALPAVPAVRKKKQATLAAGYYEAGLRGFVGETYMSIWLPLKAPAAPLATYTHDIKVAKKLRMMAAMVLTNGLPGWVPTCCLPTIKSVLPTASPALGTATPALVADRANLRGFVVFAHGLSDGPLVMAHACEQLASLGFIVAAPSFGDDDGNGSEPVLRFGHRFLAEQHVLRIHRMNACIAHLRETYGNLPLALIGYSTGTDTIRRMPIACPRIYLAGPGWVEKITGDDATPPPPGGPSLQLMAFPDATMNGQGFAADEASAFTGFPVPDARQMVSPDAVGEAFSSRGHLRADFAGFAHGSFKYVPFAQSENDAWKRLACGIVDPWDPCCKGQAVSVPELQRRAQASADAIAAWLLAWSVEA